jgi:peptidoglycan/LPS O-acetylase OafA/YrhL
MSKWSASRFLGAAVGSGLLALLMVYVFHTVTEGTLPLWLHIPVAGLTLILLSAGAAGVGFFFVEYQTRRTLSRRPAETPA